MHRDVLTLAHFAEGKLACYCITELAINDGVGELTPETCSSSGRLAVQREIERDAVAADRSLERTEYDGRSRRDAIEPVGQVVSGPDRLSIELDDASPGRSPACDAGVPANTSRRIAPSSAMARAVSVSMEARFR